MHKRSGQTSQSILAGICAAAAAVAALGLASPGYAQESSGPGGAYPGAPTPQQRNQLLENGDGQVHVLLVRPGAL